MTMLLAGLVAIGVLTTAFLLPPSIAPGVPQPVADLVVTQIDILPKDSQRVEDRIRFVATIHNNWSGTAEGFEVRFTVDGATDFGVVSVIALGPYASVEVESDNHTLAAGARSIRVLADASDSVIETDELNNERASEFEVNATRRSEQSINDEYLASAHVGNNMTDYLLNWMHIPGEELKPRSIGNTSVIRNSSNNLLLAEHVAWHHSRFVQTSLLNGPADLVYYWAHVEADPYGADFLQFHHDYLERYEKFREANAYPELPEWDPGTRIPEAFACAECGRKNELPDMPFPAWATLSGGETPDPIFNRTKLADFCTANQLGKALDANRGANLSALAGQGSTSYHSNVHPAVGGIFTGFLSPSDPVFWAFHKRIDRAYHEWESLWPHADCLPSQIEDLTSLVRTTIERMPPEEVELLVAILTSYASGNHGVETEHVH